MVDRYDVVPCKRRACGLHDPRLRLRWRERSVPDRRPLPIRDWWSGRSVAGLADPHQATLATGL